MGRLALTLVTHTFMLVVEAPMVSRPPLLCCRYVQPTCASPHKTNLDSLREENPLAKAYKATGVKKKVE